MLSNVTEDLQHKYDLWTVDSSIKDGGYQWREGQTGTMDIVDMR